MINKILIVYVSWTGVTRSVAEAVAEILRAKGAEVTVQRVQDTRDISGYDAVVLGVSAHVNKVPAVLVRFVRRHAAALAALPVAQFLVCLTMADPTPEHCQVAQGYLDQLRHVAPQMQPVATGLFAGTLLNDTEEFRHQAFWVKGFVRAMIKNTPDHRDWAAITAWAESLAALWRIGEEGS